MCWVGRLEVHAMGMAKLRSVYVEVPVRQYVTRDSGSGDIREGSSSFEAVTHMHDQYAPGRAIFALCISPLMSLPEKMTALRA